MTNKQKLHEEAAKAAEIVKSWPAWKQNLLLNSLRPTYSYCRLPVAKDSKIGRSSADPAGTDR